MGLDIDVVRQMAARATAACSERKRFKRIEAGLPHCFRSNPGGKLDPEHRKYLLEVLDWVDKTLPGA